MNVPFPFRVAAGAIAVGIDRLRSLPTELPAMSVTLAGHAVRASMRVQQELAQLAARGEEVLSTLTDRPEEHPAWAHFDDDVVDGDVVDGEVDSEVVDGGEGGEEPAGAGLSAAATTADTADGRAAERDGVGRAAAARATSAPGDDGARGGAGDARGGPLVLAGYAELTVAQLRVRLRTLDGQAVAELLEHERAGLDRAAFVTTLHNRLTSLQSDQDAMAANDGRAGRKKPA